MGWLQRLALRLHGGSDFHKAAWPTHEPRGVIRMPRTTLMQDWRSLAKKPAEPASVVPFRKAGSQ